MRGQSKSQCFPWHHFRQVRKHGNPVFTMMSHRSTDKARHYLQLLDNARCNGNWEEVPELIRKIGKYLPQRKCLLSTIQADYQIATQSASKAAPESISKLLPILSAAIENEKTYPEDVFQAQICMAWLRWILNDPAQTLSILPIPLDQTYRRLAKDGATLSGWTYVCVVKGAYLCGESQEYTGRLHDAFQTFESMLPHINIALATVGTSVEHRFWAEHLLARYCMLSNRLVKELGHKNGPLPPAEMLLKPFRAWSTFWKDRPIAELGGASRSYGRMALPRRRVWQVYHDTISSLLQQGSEYSSTTHNRASLEPPSISPKEKTHSDFRLKQINELKQVQQIYEDILLRDVNFPKANEANIEVESWADQITANWRVFSSSSWRDENFGEGGKPKYARSVLDMLYRAASRTFHSTRILRHLFLIHTTLAEFGLAHRALDSYVELVTRGKARIEKSGNPEIGVDNDATSLETAALGIQMLCEYGGRKEAERAQEIAETINKWLQKIENPENKTDANAEDVPKDLQEQQRMAGGSVLREALAAAYRGIGISHTYWAGLTYDTNSRPEWQSKAISSFRSAISFSARDRHGAQGHFLLAFILAKTRDLGAAIASVKQAISICNEILEDLDEDEDVSDPAALQDRRLLFKCWHLLAFLLSARQDFSTATASCDAASETYEGFSNPSEDTQLQGLRKILDIDERENLVELKMTQLALLEIVESPEDAVNVSGELLGVYANLFGEKSVQTSQRPPSNVGTAAEPRPLPAANGSVRSFRNSLLSWSKEPSSKRIAPSSKEDKSKDLEDSLNTQAASKPIISISLDGEAPRFNKYQPPQHLARQESKKLQKRNSRKSIDSAAGSVRRVRDRSKTRGSGSHFSDQSGQALPLRVAQIRGSSLDDSDSRPSSGSDDYSSDEVGVAVSHNMPPQSRPSTSKSVPQKIHASQPLASQVTQRKSASQAPEPPKSPQPGPIRQTSSSLQVTLPTPLFSLKEQKRHAQTLLAKIWLFIASLYRHAGMPADAQGAITEALAAVQTIENAVMAATPSEEALSKPGWGSVKSVSELWADALAEQATLYLEQGKRTDASATFEKALLWYPDHGGAIVGLSNMLLDVYEQPQERERDQERVGEGRADDEALLPPKPKPVLDALLDLDAKDASAEVQEAEALDKEERSRPSPLLLSRLAARDRAYGLLSMLTKSGRGWDDSEAWFALARSHEQSGLVDKAKEALWWVVELEEGRPVRHWSHLGRY